MKTPSSEDELSDYLRSFDSFPDNVKERDRYVSDALLRFMITLDCIPRLPGDVHLLELGSHPFFLTLLMKKKLSYHLTLANYFGPGLPHNSQTVRSEHCHEQYVFEYDNFNAEKETFPYSSESFDIVLCCEILEHLQEDPTHMLGEIHRVLKKNGYLILTTPNAIRFTNIVKILAGLNVYEKYSGYGPYGRHNREYTPGEVQRILEQNGFSDVQVMVKDIYRRPWSLIQYLPYLRHRQDAIFVTARATGTIIPAYPDFLYQSMPERRAT